MSSELDYRKRSMKIINFVFFAVPDGPPKNILAYLLGVNTIMVIWTQPERPNGDITSYKVYYTSNPNLLIGGKCCSIISYMLEYMLQHLKYTLYLLNCSYYSAYRIIFFVCWMENQANVCSCLAILI